MAIVIIGLPASVWMLGAVFILGGIYVGIEETLEDSLCAELVDEAHHGMAFGVLATFNGIGDFVSSAMVGLLWSVAGTTIAFGIAPRFSLRAQCWWLGFVRQGIPFPRQHEIQLENPSHEDSASNRVHQPEGKVDYRQLHADEFGQHH
jgi:hypothetical protein